MLFVSVCAGAVVTVAALTVLGGSLANTFEQIERDVGQEAP